MAFTSLQPFPHHLTPITNISPLTYRDAGTFLEYLETIKQWLNETLVPDSNSMIENAIEEFQTGIANAEATVNAAKNGWQGQWNEWTTERAAEYLAFVADVDSRITTFTNAINADFTSFTNSVNANMTGHVNDIETTKTQWANDFAAFMADVQAELAGLNDAATASLVNNRETETGAKLYETFSELVGIRTASPQQATAQAASGRTILGVFGNTVLAWSGFGLSQAEDGGTTWVAKTLPADLPTSAVTAGLATIVKFKGNYYLQGLKTANGLPGIYRAAPVTGANDFTWSSSLLNGTTGSKIISTGLAADESYIYFGEYGDPVSGPSVWRSDDGVVWDKVLGPGVFAARHIHGIFPDPFNPGHVYLTAGDAGSAGYNYRSVDYGLTWNKLPGSLGSSQSWQSVQMSFDENFIYFSPDTSANWAGFKADRETLTPRWMGKQSHRHLPVPGGLASRRVTDLVTVAGSATITSATANFTSADVGARIRTTGQNFVPIDSYIAAVSSATEASLFPTKAATASTTTGVAILGGETWGAMAYYGSVDPATSIYYFVSINGAAGGNVDGLFAIMPDGTVTLLDILTTSPDGRVMIENGKVWVRGFHRPLLSL